jgi:hypothetical protein
MSAVVPAGADVRQLDGRRDPEEAVTEEQVQDPGRLARLLARVLKDLTSLKRRYAPKTIDHLDRDVDATGTTLYRFPHGFGGRVHWYPIDWVGATDGERLSRHEDSDNNTLVLVSFIAGKVSIRIEKAG